MHDFGFSFSLVFSLFLSFSFFLSFLSFPSLRRYRRSLVFTSLVLSPSRWTALLALVSLPDFPPCMFGLCLNHVSSPPLLRSQRQAYPGHRNVSRSTPYTPLKLVP
jgi:hypothetical protein